MTLKGKVALVTGSTSGIGAAIASALAAQGADIALNGFGDAAAIEAMRAGLEARHGVRAAYCAADMSRPAEIDAMVAQAIASLGRVDILVNNAGIQHVSPVDSFPSDKWEMVIAVNLSACFYATRAVLPGMRARNWGRIVNIASVHGLVASVDKSAYVAAKHGLVGLTKTVALETARTGITCNAVCPGWVLTPLVEKQIAARATRNGTDPKAEAQAMVAEKQPMLKFSTPESIGAAALYFCSEHAASVTGTHLSVDGGWTAQ